MIIEWINRYYKYFVLFFVGMAFIKVIASLAFERAGGLPGIIVHIFKWYGKIEQELNDVEWQVKYMHFLNVITVFVYLSLFLLAAITLMQRLF